MPSVLPASIVAFLTDPTGVLSLLVLFTASAYLVGRRRGQALGRDEHPAGWVLIPEEAWDSTRRLAKHLGWGEDGLGRGSIGCALRRLHFSMIAERDSARAEAADLRETLQEEMDEADGLADALSKAEGRIRELEAGKAGAENVSNVFARSQGWNPEIPGWAINPEIPGWTVSSPASELHFGDGHSFRGGVFS